MILFVLGGVLGCVCVLSVWWKLQCFFRRKHGWVCSYFFSDERCRGVELCCDCELPEGVCVPPEWKILCLVDLQVGFLDLFEDAWAFFSFSGVLGKRMKKHVTYKKKLFEQTLSCAQGIVVYGALNRVEFETVKTVVQPFCSSVRGGLLRCEGAEALQGTRVVVVLDQVANSRLADLLQSEGVEVVLVQSSHLWLTLSRARKNLRAALGVFSVDYIVGTQKSLDFFFTQRVKEFAGVPVCVVQLGVATIPEEGGYVDK